MKKFLDQHFLLHNETAKLLYHDYAKEMPIIDYHNHLPPQEIADNKNFENLAAVWLHGDHYKWRAMRANGIDEKYCTGNASDFEKFEKWAETVPYTLRNPLYHWSHLELQRYFNIDKLLSPESARNIYDTATQMLQTKDFCVQNLLRKMKVEFVGTTDDPLDNLLYHKKIHADGFEIKVRPSFRPDKALLIDQPIFFKKYLGSLSETTGIDISNFNNYLDALKNRHDFFHENGCIVSDHGMEIMHAEDYTSNEIASIFNKALSDHLLDQNEIAKFKTAVLAIICEWNFEKKWVQQFHMGPIRNNNTRMFNAMGPDTGWDSMGSGVNIKNVAKFLDRLDRENKLTKTILYSINPTDNDALATMIGNFNDGSMAGKLQLGASWWFNDQKDGILQHFTSISNMGLLSRFVGMLTDSRSFLSFPRHEYFRRILCNLLGTEIENGELPNDIKLVGKMVQDISYNNAKEYFNLNK